MSSFNRPSSFSSSPSPSGDGGFGSGAKDLSYSGLNAGSEPKISGPSGAGSAGQAGASGHAAIGHAAVGHAAVGHAAIGSAIGHAAVGNAAIGHGALAAIAGGEQAISPLIQLIMRLPGATGIANSFFEWLTNLFTPGAIFSGFDPMALMHFDLAGSVASLTAVAHTLTDHLGAHLATMPTDSSMMSLGHHLGGSSLNLIDLTKTASSADHFVPNPLNLGSGADLSRSQFETLGLGGKDSLLAGPSVTHGSVSNFLAGNHRLFSDKLAGGGNFNSVTSSTSVPTTTSALPSGNTPTFGQEANGIQMPRGVDNALSGPAVGSRMQPSMDAGGSNSYSSSGASLTERMGSRNLVADNSSAYSNNAYNPSNGYYHGSNAAESSGAGGDIQPLTAKQLTYADVHKSAGGGLSKPAVDHVGHQGRGVVEHGAQPHHGAMDYCGHQARGFTHGGGNGNVMDGISHRGGSNNVVDGIAHHSTPKAYSTSSASGTAGGAHESVSITNGQPVHHQVSAAHHVLAHHSVSHPRAAQSQPAEQQQQVAAQKGGQTQGQEVAQNTDAAKPVTDQSPNPYTVHKGDSLWEIAHKNLGDGSRWSEIYKLNSDLIGKNPDLILSGAHLKLPDVGGQTIADASKYVVKPGDNLWNISKGHLGGGQNWASLYKANSNVIGANPRIIEPGQELSLPGSSSLAQAAPSSHLAQAASSGAPQMAANAPNMSAGGGMPTGGGFEGMQPVSQAPSMTPGGYGSGASMETMQVSQAGQSPMIPQGKLTIPAEYLTPTAAQAPMQAVSHISSAEGIPVTSSGVIPTQELAAGPGAAAAATLNQPPQSVVSSTLAPDLSFLHRKGH